MTRDCVDCHRAFDRKQILHEGFDAPVVDVLFVFPHPTQADDESGLVAGSAIEFRQAFLRSTAATAITAGFAYAVRCWATAEPQIEEYRLCAQQLAAELLRRQPKALVLVGLQPGWPEIAPVLPPFHGAVFWFPLRPRADQFDDLLLRFAEKVVPGA